MRRWVLVVTAALLLGWARPAFAQDLYPGETETYLINYEAFSKCPSTAYLLSLAPGFGAGHFYAGHVTRGVVMGVGEVLGIALTLLAPQVGNPGDTAQDVLLYSGLAVFGLFKIADMFLAPNSVELHNKKVAKRLKIRALALRQRPERSGGHGRLAYGLALEGSFNW